MRCGSLNVRSKDHETEALPTLAIHYPGPGHVHPTADPSPAHPAAPILPFFSQISTAAANANLDSISRAMLHLQAGVSVGKKTLDRMKVSRKKAGNGSAEPALFVVFTGCEDDTPTATANALSFSFLLLPHANHSKNIGSMRPLC